MDTPWRTIPVNTYVCIKYIERGGVKIKPDTHGYIVNITNTACEFYFKRFGKIKINFSVPIENIKDLCVETPPVKTIKGGNGTNRQALSQYIGELQTIKLKVDQLATQADATPIKTKIESLTESVATLSTDTDRRLTSANQQLRRILDTVDSRFATHADNIKVIATEFKTITARISKLELSIDSINTRIARIGEWMRKHT